MDKKLKTFQRSQLLRVTKRVARFTLEEVSFSLCALVTEEADVMFSGAGSVLALASSCLEKLPSRET